MSIQTHLAEAGQTRAAPPLFVTHAVTGAHREWMIRGFSLAAFFITFSLWDHLLAAMPMSPATAFALAVLVGWSLNLIVAEVWIRRTRTGRNPS
jgi:hypothetical protein